MIKKAIHYIFYKLFKSADLIERNIVKLKGGAIGAVSGFFCFLLALPAIELVTILTKRGINVYLLYFILLAFLGCFLLFVENYFKKKVSLIKEQFQNEPRAKSISGTLIINLGIIIYFYFVVRYIRK